MKSILRNKVQICSILNSDLDLVIGLDHANDLDLLHMILIFCAMILIFDLDQKKCDLLQLWK